MAWEEEEAQLANCSERADMVVAGAVDMVVDSFVGTLAIMELVEYGIAVGLDCCICWRQVVGLESLAFVVRKVVES